MLRTRGVPNGACPRPIGCMAGYLHPSRASAVLTGLTAFTGAGQLCHAPPTAKPATGCADLQGLTAYHPVWGNLTSLPLQQRPSRASAVFTGLTSFHGSGAARSRSANSKSRHRLRCPLRPSSLVSGAAQPRLASPTATLVSGQRCLGSPVTLLQQQKPPQAALSIKA